MMVALVEVMDLMVWYGWRKKGQKTWSDKSFFSVLSWSTSVHAKSIKKASFWFILFVLVCCRRQPRPGKQHRFSFTFGRLVLVNEKVLQPALNI